MVWTAAYSNIEGNQRRKYNFYMTRFWYHPWGATYVKNKHGTGKPLVGRLTSSWLSTVGKKTEADYRDNNRALPPDTALLSWGLWSTFSRTRLFRGIRKEILQEPPGTSSDHHNKPKPFFGKLLNELNNIERWRHWFKLCKRCNINFHFYWYTCPQISPLVLASKSRTGDYHGERNSITLMNNWKNSCCLVYKNQLYDYCGKCTSCCKKLLII